MTGLALLLVLTAAVLHAIWNLLAKRASGGIAFLWLFCLISAVIYAPVAVAVLWIQKPEMGWPQWIAVAGTLVLHTAYYIVLQRGYRLGDLSLVYPLARGTGPLLSTVAAIVLLGERPTPLALLGALLIVGCVFVIAGGGSPASRNEAKVRWALRYGLWCGVLIAAYTLWDKQAVAVLLIPPLLLDWFNNLGRTILLTPLALRHWGEVKDHWGRHRLEAVGIAILSPLSYILVLTAMTFTPVSYVAPAREISILLGTLLGTQLLAEQGGQQRLWAAGGMVLGVVALALG
jgi:drug/metabolite transporter (DMT)-like permease